MTAVSEAQTAPPAPPDIAGFFPMAGLRDKQKTGLEFIQKAVDRGYKHIVLSAPTGTGKSPVGVTFSRWINSVAGRYKLDGADGAYYLVTQKLLQNQLESDARRYTGEFQSLKSVKSGTEYTCPKFKNCGLGGRKKGKGKEARCACDLKSDGGCPYDLAKRLFESSNTAVTNYPYFFAERTYVGKFPKRKGIVLDECHNIESQAVKFVDSRLSTAQAKELGITIEVPELRTLYDFIGFSKKYLEEAQFVYDCRLSNDAEDEKQSRLTVELDRHICKLRRAIEEVSENPDGWVFWESPLKSGGNEYIVRPLSAAGFLDELVFDAADIKLYMSAYPGEKTSFCRSLGLDPDKVAYAALGSSFPVSNRPIVMSLVGPMGMRNVDATLPAFLKLVGKILKLHADEKGLVHCNSYKLGEAIMAYFENTKHGERLLFPRSAEERDAAFLKHSTSLEPTVMISPSMTEGYDFSDDLARWQVIAKVPYPNLGDAWVAAKKESDEHWYAQTAISTIVQATGRIVRSGEDRGITYIVDEDFRHLWDRHREKFPNWWKSAMVWP